MGLETDLDEIRKLAEERDDENWKFCTFLKQRDGVDKRAYRILEGVLAGIDCTTCGNCCLTMEVCVTDTDVARLAVHLSVTPKKFREQYVVRDEHGNARLRGRPCVFLEGKRCSVYDARPEDCRAFPHLHKKGIVSLLMGVIGNYSVCPIVFNVYERLKDEMWQGRGKR
jgi:hypothetical protein